MTELIVDHPGGFKALLDTLVEDRVAARLGTLIVSHRNGTITAQEALSGIAEIAALRGLSSALAARIRNQP